MYVYYFDIAAILLTLVIGLLNCFGKKLKNETYYILNLEIILIFITPIADMVAIFAQFSNWPSYIFEIANFIFYFTQLEITVLFFQLIVNKVVFQHNINKLLKVILSIPAILFIIILLSNPFTHLVWTFSSVDHSYTHGILGSFMMLVPMFYFGFTYVFIFFFKNGYDLYVKSATNLALILNLTTIFIEYKMSNIMLHSFGFSLALVLMFVCIRSSNTSVDNESGIPNIYYYVEYIEKLFFTKTPFSINFIRIADYELFLSTYGYNTTNTIMKEIAKRLTASFKIGEVFEINTNYFAIITTTPEDNPVYQKKIKMILDSQYTVENVEIAFSYFIVGLSYPKEVKNFDDIISYGHYIERMHRKRYGIVDPSELSLKDTVREKAVELAIERGLKNNNFDVYYQPIYNLKERKFTTAEALVRLKDPELGFISPAEFIPISERNGSIVRIGNFVMESVFKFISEHNLEKLCLEYVELNLSTIQCLQRSFMDNLYINLKDYSVDPHTVCFEITETASNCAPDIFNDNLTKLAKGGYKLAIDDYGTGFANFNRLMDGHFSILKFDKSTVEQVCKKDSKKMAFKNLTNLTHALGYHIVAEGVETEAQKNFLEEIGIDFIQGYLYSKPLPMNEYLDFLNENNK